MSVLDRDGVAIHYEVAGDGPALLLTHGYSASASMYASVVPALARRNRVITWDMRGHGRSDYPSDPAKYSVELSIGDMLALLDATGSATAVVLGHSLGGFLSLELQRVAPERVAALVLVDTGPGYRSDEARAQWNGFAESFARGFAERGLDALGDSDELRAEDHRDATGLVHAARGILRQHDAAVLEHLPAVDVPTLVVVGEDDTPFVAGSHYMADKIPDAQLAVIAGAGHAPMVSHPAELLAVVEPFLARRT